MCRYLALLLYKALGGEWICTFSKLFETIFFVFIGVIVFSKHGLSNLKFSNRFTEIPKNHA